MSNALTDPQGLRELAHRASSDLEVTLYWSADDDSVSLKLVQHATDETLRFTVARERALDAFYHPFAHLPTPRHTADEVLTEWSRH